MKENDLPAHKASLHLSHNEHLGIYEPIADALADLDDHDITPEDRAECLRTNSLWILHWYPETPVGFCRVAAATLERVLERVQS